MGMKVILLVLAVLVGAGRADAQATKTRTWFGSTIEASDAGPERPRPAGPIAVHRPKPTRPLPSSLRPLSASEVVRRLARHYVGHFRWDSGLTYQNVRFHFDSLEVADDGRVIALGRGTYLNERLTAIALKAVVHPKTLAIEIFESEPRGRDVSSFVTDGSHTGTVAADGRSIRATWRTRKTRRRGALVLRAYRPSFFDEAQGSVLIEGRLFPTEGEWRDVSWRGSTSTVIRVVDGKLVEKRRR